MNRGEVQKNLLLSHMNLKIKMFVKCLPFFSFPAFYTKKAGQLKFRLTLRSLLLIFNILYI